MKHASRLAVEKPGIAVDPKPLSLPSLLCTAIRVVALGLAIIVPAILLAMAKREPAVRGEDNTLAASVLQSNNAPTLTMLLAREARSH
jgi:hypothetical protein